MTAVSKASLKQIFGSDINVPVVDLTFGSSWDAWNPWLAPTGRLVTSAIVNADFTTTVTFTAGDNTPFVVGNFVYFPDDPNNGAYQITAVGTNSITVQSALTSAQINAIRQDNISTSYSIAGSTYKWLVQEYTSDGVTETRDGLNLGTLSVKSTPNALNWSTYITTYNAAQGLAKINVPSSAFTTQPMPADAPKSVTPVIIGGSIIITKPAGTDPIANPISMSTQRWLFLVWSNLSPLTV